MKDFTIIISGLPGSGKGSQGKILQKRFTANYIVTGDIIRQIRQKKNKLSQEVNKRYNQGIPQPDYVIVDIFKSTVKKLLLRNKKFIFDGFPRSLNQAKILDKFCLEIKISPPFFVYLRIKPQTVIKRLSQRFFCNQCGTSYLPSQIQNHGKICANCNAVITHRDQDSIGIVKKRISKEEAIIDKLLVFYKKLDRLIIIDGEPTIDQVTQSILKSLDEKGII